MKTLHNYLIRQVLGSLAMTVMVFTFVLLLGNALKELLPLMVSGQLRFAVVAEAIGLLVPFVWAFALPMGMLTATLLIFGRFSADQEFTAVRASGVSLLSLVSPILLLSLALCGVSALVNMEIGPRCRIAYKSMLLKLRVEFSTAYLPEGRFVRDFPGYVFYVGKNRKGELQDVMILKLINDTNIEQTLRAPRGKLEIDAANRRLNLYLYDCQTISLSGALATGYSQEAWVPLELGAPPTAPLKPKIDDMTFMQLWKELHELQRWLNLPLSLKGLTPEQRAAKARQWSHQQKDLMTPVMFHLNRQVAFSFACFGFTLLGIPLGIRVHQRETNIGIAIALFLVGVYYSFILVGQSFSARSEYLPYLIVWAPNFLFQAVGAVLLWRANRGV